MVAAADIAWDVGAVYDPAAGRFDHHQRGAREDGMPYSAARLVWRHHREAPVRGLLEPSVPPRPGAAARSRAKFGRGQEGIRTFMLGGGPLTQQGRRKPMETLYTASATATGGRAGHVRSQEGGLDFDLAWPICLMI